MAPEAVEHKKVLYGTVRCYIVLYGKYVCTIQCTIRQYGICPSVAVQPMSCIVTVATLQGELLLALIVLYGTVWQVCVQYALYGTMEYARGVAVQPRSCTAPVATLQGDCLFCWL